LAESFFEHLAYILAESESCSLLVEFLLDRSQFEDELVLEPLADECFAFSIFDATLPAHHVVDEIAFVSRLIRPDVNARAIPLSVESVALDSVFTREVHFFTRFELAQSLLLKIAEEIVVVKLQSTLGIASLGDL